LEKFCYKRGGEGRDTPAEGHSDGGQPHGSRRQAHGSRRQARGGGGQPRDSHVDAVLVPAGFDLANPLKVSLTWLLNGRAGTNLMKYALMDGEFTAAEDTTTEEVELTVEDVYTY
jgi:hypothetical protein